MSFCLTQSYFKYHNLAPIQYRDMEAMSLFINLMTLQLSTSQKRIPFLQNIPNPGDSYRSLPLHLYSCFIAYFSRLNRFHGTIWFSLIQQSPTPLQKRKKKKKPKPMQFLFSLKCDSMKFNSLFSANQSNPPLITSNTWFWRKTRPSNILAKY